MTDRQRYKLLRRIAKYANYQYDEIDWVAMKKYLKLQGTELSFLGEEGYLLWKHVNGTLTLRMQPKASEYLESRKWRGFSFWLPVILSVLAIIIALIALAAQLGIFQWPPQIAGMKSGHLSFILSVPFLSFHLWYVYEIVNVRSCLQEAVALCTLKIYKPSLSTALISSAMAATSLGLILLRLSCLNIKLYIAPLMSR